MHLPSTIIVQRFGLENVNMWKHLIFQNAIQQLNSAHTFFRDVPEVVAIFYRYNGN